MKEKWGIEIAEWLGVMPDLVHASRHKGLEGRVALDELLVKAHQKRPQKPLIYGKVKHGERDDLRRSETWKNYLPGAFAQEYHAKGRAHLFGKIYQCIVSPMLHRTRPIYVLDYGCGTSGFTRYLLSKTDQIIPVLCDIDSLHLDFARDRTTKLQPKTKVFTIHDPAMLPTGLPAVDVVYCHTVFEHLPNVRKVIDLFLEILKDNAVLIETYSGYSEATPVKSDTYNAYRNRDTNLDYLQAKLILVHGRIPKRLPSRSYGQERSVRYWMKPTADPAFQRFIRYKLGIYSSFLVCLRGLLSIRRWIGMYSGFF